MKKIIYIAVGTILFILFGAPMLDAQDRDSERRGRREGGDRQGGPPWGGGPMGGGRMGGGPPWGGGPMGGGDGGSDRNDRMIGMLRSMDTNNDGKLELREIPEYRRNFVSTIVTRMGGDPNKTIVLADLQRRAENSRNENRSSSGNARSGNASSLPADPLVPYFGEKQLAEAPVIAFGQREPQPKTSTGSSSGLTSSGSASDQILRTARNIMNRYDKNKNGTLDKDKGEWVSDLPFSAKSADKNFDGRISMTELIAALGGKAGATSGAAAVATKQSTAYDRLPVGVPDWFFERDKDQDAQLSMMEYANGKAWTEAIADEFRFLDKNNDGYATVTEVFATLKEVDEAKRLKEEQAQREQERRQGASIPASTTPGETPPGTPPAQPGQPGQPVPPPGDPGQAPSPVPSTSPPPTPPGANTEAGQPAPRPPVGPPQIPTSAPYSSGSEPEKHKDKQHRENRDYRNRPTSPNGGYSRRSSR